MTLALRARAAFASGYGECGTFPLPIGAKVACQAIESSPYLGADLAPIVEAGRTAGGRAAREQSHASLYEYHRRELAALLMVVLGRVDREALAATLVDQAKQQTAIGATPETRRKVLVATALAGLRQHVHPEDRASLDSLNAAGWSHATAYGRAEATATPATGGTPKAGKVAALALGALTALGTGSGVAETATWTDAELETIAMGAAIAAGDGKAIGDLARKVADALYSSTRAQNVYVAQLHKALNQAFVTRANQLFATPQFAWIINSGNPCPTCTALAAAGPYAASALPTLPPIHPGCLCNLEVVSAVPALV